MSAIYFASLEKERYVKIRNRSFMTIFLDDILNLEFTTNLRRGIPVSVKTKGQKRPFGHQRW